MSDSAFRLVLDTNVLLAGLVSKSSASQKVVDLLKARGAVPLVSPQVMAEYRAVLFHPTILARFPALTPERIELALRRVRYIADEYQNVRARFQFDRDPRDAMFIELAIVGSATQLITLDADLLSLPAAHTDAGRRFRQRLPSTAVLRPEDFLERYGKLLDG